MIDLSNSYIDTMNDPKEKIKVQLVLFALGYYWSGKESLLESCSRYIYISSNKKLEYNSTIVTFRPYCNYKQISLEEIYKL